MGKKMTEKLHLQKVKYSYSDLAPVMSEDTLEYHRDNLAAGYVKRFNKREGDSAFNEAGAFLHNIFFPQLQPPKQGNKPYGSSLTFIEDKYKSFDSFKEEFTKAAMSIQGSGWVYLSRDGKIKIIKNHEIKKDIVLLVDWWEHAWALDYQSDKSKYLKNIWRIIDWSVVNERINLTKSSRLNKIKKLFIKASSFKPRKLSDILFIKTDLKDADFWIWRKHNPGRPIREYHPEAIGIKVKEEYLDQLDSRYLYYIFEYYNMSKFWKQYEGGTAIKSIRVSDVQNLPLSFLSPGS